MIFALAILTLFLSGFFSGVEIAFVSSNPLRVELKRQRGSRRGKLLASFFEKPSDFLGTTLVGNNLALVAFGILIERILEEPVLKWVPQVAEQFQEFTSLFLITVISTVIVLIFGEFIPKVLFRLSPSKVLYFLTYPLQVIKFFLTPFVWVMVNLSYGLINLLVKGRIEESQKVFGRVDLEHFIKDATPDNDEEIDTDLFENALYLTNVKVKACMVPRTEIIGFDIENEEGIKGLRKAFIDSGLSKIIIYKESFDDILGYVHHQQILKNPESIEGIEILPIPIVPEVLQARELMNRFIKKQISIACVVDEFGGTAGICTLEDILEEIVGEIADEHDEEEYIEKEIAVNEFLFSGRLEIDYINEKYDMNIPTGDYHTLSGYIVITNETLPEKGDRIELDQFEFIMETMSDTKIETVRMRKVANSDE
ncbi:MAG: hemolysin family protein [Bacteroidota bacterium]